MRGVVERGPFQERYLTVAVAVHPFFPFKKPTSDSIKRGCHYDFPAGDANAYRRGLETYLRHHQSLLLTLTEARDFGAVRRLFRKWNVNDSIIVRSENERVMPTNTDWDTLCSRIQAVQPYQVILFGGVHNPRSLQDDGSIHLGYGQCLDHVRHELLERDIVPVVKEELTFQ